MNQPNPTPSKVTVPTPPANPPGETQPPPPPPASVASVKLYFSKALLTNQILAAGKVIPWEPLDDNQGVIMLDSVADAAVVKDLDTFVEKQSGGVLKISAQEYEDLKKNHPYRQLGPKSWQQEQLKVAGRKGFKPPAPQPSVARPAAPPVNGATAPAGTPGPLPPIGGTGDDVPQRAPDQPDFKTAGNFKPATARLPDPANVEKK